MDSWVKELFSSSGGDASVFFLPGVWVCVSYRSWHPGCEGVVVGSLEGGIWRRQKGDIVRLCTC